MNTKADVFDFMFENFKSRFHEIKEFYLFIYLFIMSSSRIFLLFWNEKHEPMFCVVN